MWEALRDYVERGPRWKDDSRRRVLWVHLVVLPNSDLGADFDCPDAPRWMVADKLDLPLLGDVVRRALVGQQNRARAVTDRDVADR